MLRVIVGNDVVSVRSSAHALLSAHEGDVVRITTENYLPGLLADYVNAQSLFGGSPEPVVLDFLSEYEEALGAVVEHLPALVESERLFVFLDVKPKAREEKLLRKHAAQYTEVAEPATQEKFNTFALADALARKDKKSLWVLLQRARLAGVAPEEIAGLLFWQLKSLLLAERTVNAEEAGMKDFPYKKAKAAVREFKKGEIVQLSEALLTLYHKGHADSDMAAGLERFALTL